jgi:hypothetical protein
VSEFQKLSRSWFVKNQSARGLERYLNGVMPIPGYWATISIASYR